MTDTKKLEAEKDFATGCKCYQNGVEVRKNKEWPLAQENISFKEVLNQTKKTYPIERGNGR